MEGLRGRDEEKELIDEGEAARFQQLSLQPLYARPPPIWLHPAFAAEFGDAFIAGTGLESGTLHVSLEVIVLAVEQMFKEGGLASEASGVLKQGERAALNSALSSLSEAKRLAHKLAHAAAHDGQQRMYLSRVQSSLQDLEPGGLLPIPCSVGGEPIILMVHRGSGNEADTCTLAVISCEAEGNALKHHRSEASPPKIRFETCLELRSISYDKLQDEALWTLIWFAGTLCQQDGKLTPAKVFYQVALSFLSGQSLEQAMIHSDELRDEGNEEVQPYRTPRRSKSAHYGCVRHALSYILRVHGVTLPSRKIVSLLLRQQLLLMAHHDLHFVKHVSTAERAILSLACRQLAYKAAKMGKVEEEEAAAPVVKGGGGEEALSRVATEEAALTDKENVAAREEAALTAVTEKPSPKPKAALLDRAQLTSVRASIAAIQVKLTTVPGDEPDASAPPPLILCKANEHLGRPSISMLLGLDEAGEGLLPAANTTTTSSMKPSIKEAEVIGLYFSAGWCPACKTATPLVATAYQQLKQRTKPMEIVFVSLDKDDTTFNETRANMPWPSLPFGGTRSALLAEAFHVQGIPTLVLLRQDGSLISTDGIRLLRKHARAFPWLPKSPPPMTPHLHPLYERLLRPHPVDTGLAHELPSYTPIDLLQLPLTVTTLEQAIDAIRHTDRLATLISVQSHSVKNTRHLVASLIQFTFTQLLPMPKALSLFVGLATIKEEQVTVVEEEEDAATIKCIWREPMAYSDQLDLLLLLQRIMEHFASAAFSLDHTQSMDAVRMVVPACIACVADVVMRQVATDIPSEVCTHLRKFAVSTGYLAKQSATIPVHMPELNLAKEACLDYFNSFEKLPKIFEWQKSEKLDEATSKYLKAVCIDVAFPTDEGHLFQYITDVDR